MSAPFGYSYLLDMYHCDTDTLSDVEVNYLFLERLPKLIGMTPFSPPIVIKEPATFHLDENGNTDRLPDYPDKAGISGVIFLITSSIVLHTIEPKKFATIDVYSCKTYDPKIIFDECKRFFGFQDHDGAFVKRGERY